MFVFVFPSADIVLVRSIRHALLSPFSAYKKRHGSNLYDRWQTLILKYRNNLSMQEDSLIIFRSVRPNFNVLR